MWSIKTSFVPEFCRILRSFERPLGLDMVFMSPQFMHDSEVKFPSRSLCGQVPGYSESWRRTNYGAGFMEDTPDLRMVRMRSFDEWGIKERRQKLFEAHVTRQARKNYENDASYRDWQYTQDPRRRHQDDRRRYYSWARREAEVEDEKRDKKRVQEYLERTLQGNTKRGRRTHARQEEELRQQQEVLPGDDTVAQLRQLEETVKIEDELADHLFAGGVVRAVVQTVVMKGSVATEGTSRGSDYWPEAPALPPAAPPSFEQPGEALTLLGGSSGSASAPPRPLTADEEEDRFVAHERLQAIARTEPGEGEIFWI